MCVLLRKKCVFIIETHHGIRYNITTDINFQEIADMKPLAQRQVHLDFHTSEDISDIGSMFDKEQFKRCLKKGHVNSVTLFAKCHHGWAYFPSETNKMHPGLKFDLLSAMLRACAEAGVDAPIYLSAGLDEKYFVEHPDHAVQFSRNYYTPEIKEKPSGKYASHKPEYSMLCFNSPYFDVLMAQIEEVVRKFMPVGIFLDIVNERTCFCPYCMKLAEEYGMDVNDDRSFEELGRITYKKYYDAVRKTATAIKPDIRIFHNGGHIQAGRRELACANTHLELESLPTGGWGYDHFPKSAKYVSNLGMDFLGMTGKFHLSWGEFGGYKHPNALRYEVALSLANGAKCSIGDQMHPYAFLDEATYESIGIAYKEAEAVEEYCYGVSSVADVAVLLAESYTQIKNHTADIGACRTLLEGHVLFDVIDADCDFSKYKVIILPDAALPDSLGDKLAGYVNRGGKLLATGAAMPRGAFDLGARCIGKCEFRPAYVRPSWNALGLSPTNYVIYSQMYDAAATDGAKALGYIKRPFFNRAPEHFSSHTHTPYKTEEGTPAVTVGKDGAYIAFDVFTEYSEIGSAIAKETVLKVIGELLAGSATLKTNLPSAGVVTLNNQSEHSRYVLHALYASPQKRGGTHIFEFTTYTNPALEVIEDLIPMHGTSFELKTEKQIKRVTLVPQNKELPFECSDGRIRFVIDEFTCSQVVALDY